MKMPEKHVHQPAILAAKEQNVGLNPCVCNGVPSRRIMAVRLKTVIDATMCAIIAWFIRDLLDFAGLSSRSWAFFPNGVFIGYIGTDSIGSLIKQLC